MSSHHLTSFALWALLENMDKVSDVFQVSRFIMDRYDPKGNRSNSLGVDPQYQMSSKSIWKCNTRVGLQGLALTRSPYAKNAQKRNENPGRISGFHSGKMQIVVFWVVTPCSVVGGYQRFGKKRIAFVFSVNTYKTTQHHDLEDHNPQKFW